MKRKSSDWIQKTHFLRADEYICSACGSTSEKSYSVCPVCGARMKKTKYDPTWVDEAEELSDILDDDW